jgi:hypothetical protein
VNRYSKIAYFILTTIDVDVPALAELIYDEVVKYHDIFKLIISDRGSIFIFKWWSSFCHYWIIRSRISTAFHPQTDGQTERQNQTLEAYLRSYVNYHQDDLCLTYTPSMQMNPDAEDSTLIGESPAIREKVEIRIKYAEEYADL